MGKVSNNKYIKGLSNVLLPFLYKRALKKLKISLDFDLVMMPTPPITLLNLALWVKNKLVRVVKNNQVLGDGGLEDYAYIAQGLYYWNKLSNNEEDKRWSISIVEQAWERFHNSKGWVLSENSLLKYGQSEYVISDGVLPSASAILINTAFMIDETNKKPSSSLRVDSNKIDLLINYMSEIVIANSKILTLVEQEENTELEEASSRMKELLESVRDGIMDMRMVQVGESFNKFRRIVNDTSKKIGKDVEFVITGGETELDKTVVEKISDPLVHMLRNSIDHGVEMPDVRLAQGKVETGTIKLKAYNEGNAIVIQIDDDGNGVFSGHVSLENNGGFCLIKHDINRISVEKYSSFVIKLKGDGKKYAFRCKSGEHQRHTYSYSFKTTIDWQTIQIPFKEMEAVFRGDNLELPNYHGDFLAQIAFIIKNGVAEDFTLKIDSIKIV